MAQHTQLGAMRVLAAAARFEGERVRNALPCPLLGEHTHAVLYELGRTRTDIEALTAAGTIRDQGTTA